MMKRIGVSVLCICMLITMLPIYVYGATEASEENVVESIEAGTESISGTVTGLETDDYGSAEVILYDAVNAYTSVVDETGKYSFQDIAAGDYYLKIDVAGYEIPAPEAITIVENETIEKNIAVTAVEDDGYFYQWKADDTYFGYEESAKVPEEKTFVFLDELVYVCDTNAAAKLEQEYKIILSNEELTWNLDYSSRLLELVETIYGFNKETVSKWILTSDEIDDDIEITYGEFGNVVRINKAAFENAIPRKAQYNGLKGKYFSNRLYHAIIRYASSEGTDITFIDNLLKYKYGCSILVDDYEALTKGITNETAAAFEMFKAEELLAILEMFAEMPEGFHKIENLEYLVRRIDGSKNPIYPQAAAVSWIYAEYGYIEFMDMAFLGSEVEDTFRLVLHEKSHFLWQYVFSDELKQAWAEIGGWYESDEDSDGWATSKETEFVTAYAHAHNPDEDMAESIAYYILMPDKLESRSPDKYEFIRDYIMNGEIFKAEIREDLTFEVYNLYPDYNYPGRIVGVDLNVAGAPDEDKQLTVTVTLDTNGDKSYGASYAFLRVYSEVDTFYDMYLMPINEDHSVLQGTITISKYSCNGYWYCEQITLTDEVGNQRFSGVDSYGWKLYIDNALYDIEMPEYICDSIYIETEEGMIDGRPVTYVHVKLKATDNIGIDSVYCEMANDTTNGYRMDNYGTFDNETGEGIITYTFTEYMQSGSYAVNFLRIKDYAGNYALYNFYADGTGAGKPATFIYESEHSDYEEPELDLNNISVSAYPTHPEAPNGETVVTITYLARDNASGLGHVSFQLLDPMGNTHMQYHYHENFYTLFYEGDPTAWTEYEINIILPEGSAPGTWGLLEFYMCDKAGNAVHYNFLETIHFVVEDEPISVEPEAELQILVQPEDQNVCLNSYTTFEVKAEGEGLTYQWQYSKSGNMWYDSGMDGAKTSSLTVQGLLKRDGQKYRCVVTDAEGNQLISEVAVLTINTYVFEIIAHPESQTVNENEYTTFTVEAEGEGLTYQWQYSKSGNMWYNSGMEGAKTSSLTLQGLLKRDGQMYRCVVTDAEGNQLISAVAVLTIDLDVFKIIAHPESQTVNENEYTTFTVEAEGEGLTYQWQFSQSGNMWYDSGMEGAKTSRLTVQGLRKRDGQMYRCVVTDAEGNQLISAVAILNVN